MHPTEDASEQDLSLQAGSIPNTFSSIVPVVKNLRWETAYVILILYKTAYFILTLYKTAYVILMLYKPPTLP